LRREHLQFPDAGRGLPRSRAGRAGTPASVAGGYDSGRVSRNKIPSAMNTPPAIRRSHSGEITRLTPAPAATAIADVAHSASADPMNTASFDLPPADSDSAASWVLSPISATKIDTNDDTISFQSMPTS